MDKAKIIKETLNIRDVATRYGIQLDRNGKAKCPFHSEKTASFSINNNKKYYKCFGCGKGGDVINLIMELYKLDFVSSVNLLDQDFRLGLTTPSKRTRIDRIKIAQEEDKRNKDLEKQILHEQHYWDTLAEYKRLDDNRRKYKPKQMFEELHPLFIESLQKIALQEFKLDLAEFEG